jgi:hypothetical protein
MSKRGGGRVAVRTTSIQSRKERQTPQRKLAAQGPISRVRLPEAAAAPFEFGPGKATQEEALLTETLHVPSFPATVAPSLPESPRPTPFPQSESDLNSWLAQIPPCSAVVSTLLPDLSVAVVQNTLKGLERAEWGGAEHLDNAFSLDALASAERLWEQQQGEAATQQGPGKKPRWQAPASKFGHRRREDGVLPAKNPLEAEGRSSYERRQEIAFGLDLARLLGGEWLTSDNSSDFHTGSHETPPTDNQSASGTSPAACTAEQRRAKIARFLQKRKQRVWKKRAIEYDVRKEFADSRLRVRGRFIGKGDEALLREVMGML